MMDIPATHWAETADGESIAYQHFGAGPGTIVFVAPWINHLEASWAIPERVALLQRLAAFSRVIYFDARGTGMSDRLAAVPTLEQRTDDILAVMDATGTNRAALLGLLDGAALAAFFAATRPDRVDALVFCGYPRTMWAPDYPWGWTQEAEDSFLARIVPIWGDEDHAEEFEQLISGDWPLPSADPERARQHAKWARLAATPRNVRTFERMWQETDVRDLLPSVRVPTLVLAAADDEEDLLVGEYVAERVPQARIAAYPGYPNLFLADSGPIAETIREFLGAPRPAPDRERVLATVLFTDVVGSTRKAAELGDAQWKTLLERHNRTVRQILRHHGGREVSTAGDGFLATFDGPSRAVKCARAICEAVKPLGLEVRAGCHTGEIELMGADVGGVAVHIGARVAALAGPSEVLVRSTVKDLVAGSGLVFEDRGEHALKGVPEMWRLYAAVPGTV
jgi:class 3 adenylate cyclase/alpha-beta hydrolase superfamily lysophospholipase